MNHHHRSCSNRLEWNRITCTAHSTKAKALLIDTGLNGECLSWCCRVRPAFWTTLSERASWSNGVMAMMCGEKKRIFYVIICAHTLRKNGARHCDAAFMQCKKRSVSWILTFRCISLFLSPELMLVCLKEDRTRYRKILPTIRRSKDVATQLWCREERSISIDVMICLSLFCVCNVL